ncbi:nodulation protein NolU [Bradyrhizobium sp. LHD-71]|uniref:nodulation protein NolU n=1 Tax=Bradyrhizobium sp. LHD-71 TaxID=3072141 RepID=UPI00280FC875|nr:nodulation protein NolU [Bradyrhizobium sp. LHD-71]MDQ8726885.1 nodulation protein NolU [Bradyrhizobium sp. LHD-71]
MPATSTPGSAGKEALTRDASRLALAAHPQRLADAFDRRLSVAVVSRLQGCPRLHERIATLLLHQRGADSSGSIADNAPAERRETFERLFQVDLKEASHLAGAAWHAHSLRQIIHGRDVADLIARIGRRAHAFGLRRGGVAPAMRSPASDALAEQIERDGHACLGVWFSSFPSSMRQQLYLRLPPDTAAETPDLSDAQQKLALGLIDPVLSELDESMNAFE